MQILFETQMTSEEYVSERGWERATLDSCPVHRDSDCGLRAHGSYARKHPTGVRIARWYCASGQVTFSLLPEFLAAGFSATLSELEAATTLSEQASSINEAARQLRPELDDERTAARWLRRRLSAISQGLTALVTSLPELWGTAPTLSAVGAKLGAAGGAILVTLRRTALSLLSALPAPLGFRHRRTAVRNSAEALQHTVGPVRRRAQR
jgi:hypothetical protein